MYIIVESVNNIALAKARIKTVMDAKGYPENFSKFLFGENKNGYANGKEIKNNIVLSVWSNDIVCFEVDYNIVKKYGEDIKKEIAKHSDTHWCTAEEVKKYTPEVLDVI